MTEDLPELSIVPCTLDEAKAYVRRFHRHLDPKHAHRFSLAVADETGTVRGVAMVGNPVARNLNDGYTLEVNRCCTDGCPNAASCLYGACWRAAKALGFRELVTYTLPSESGASLRAAGWRRDGETEGGPWERKGRPREDDHPTCGKVRWKIDRDIERPDLDWPTGIVGPEATPELEEFMR